MLHYRIPDNLEVDRWLGQFSQHRRHQGYSIGQSGRFNGRSFSAAGALGPGQYRTTRDWPENDNDEMGTQAFTGSKPAPKYSFNTDSRVAPLDGVLKGLSQTMNKKPNMLGPGQYNAIRVGSKYYKAVPPSYSIPAAKESADAVRERKRQGFSPGPGIYEVHDRFEEMGMERQKALRKLATRGKKSAKEEDWAHQQYSHIFTCMKPTRGDPKRQATPAAVPTATLTEVPATT